MRRTVAAAKKPRRSRGQYTATLLVVLDVLVTDSKRTPRQPTAWPP